jgi:eukaryotic-like serine/threonine-protein kinase
MMKRGLAVAALLVALSGCSALRVSPGGLAASEWHTAGGSNERTSATSDAVNGLQERWRYNGTAGFGPDGAIISGRYVIVGNRRGEIQVLDAPTGRHRGVSRFGEVIEGSPALLGHVLYVPLAAGENGLRAFDLAAGRQRWRVRSEAPIEASVLASPEVIVMAVATGAIRALDARSGAVLWEVEPELRTERIAAPVRAGDAVIVAGGDGSVEALDFRTGATLWTTNVDAPVRNNPAVVDGVVFLTTTRGQVVALDAATGKVRWQAQPSTGELTGPSVSGTHVAVGGSDRRIHLLDHEGHILWSADGGTVMTAAPLLTGSSVVVGTHGGEVRVHDLADGSLLQSLSVRGRVRSAPAYRGGLLVVLTDARQVYAFDVEHRAY